MCPRNNLNIGKVDSYGKWNYGCDVSLEIRKIDDIANLFW